MSTFAEASTGRPDPSSSVAGSSSSASASPTEANAGFLVDPDGPDPLADCSIWEEDCEPGFKCMPWANNGGNTWNALKCTPVDARADAAGEPCTVTESGVSGIDTCELHSMCWSVDGRTGVGECVPFCSGSEANPSCDDATRFCAYGGEILNLCLSRCDPLVQDCRPGDACYLNQEFQCIPDASRDAGADGDVCEFINACDPGLMCAAATTLSDCDGSTGCCTPFCDLSAPGTCGVEACVPLFDPNDPPAGLEDVGTCRDPG